MGQKGCLRAAGSFPQDHVTEIIAHNTRQPDSVVDSVDAHGLTGERNAEIYDAEVVARSGEVRHNGNVRMLCEVRTMVLHSTVTSKGQTTIPGKIRKVLRIKPGDRLEYVVEGDRATIRVHPGTRSLKGALASKKGKGMSFAQIREAAATAARNRSGAQ